MSIKCAEDSRVSLQRDLHRTVKRHTPTIIFTFTFNCTFPSRLPGVQQILIAIGAFTRPEYW